MKPGGTAKHQQRLTYARSIVLLTVASVCLGIGFLAGRAYEQAQPQANVHQQGSTAVQKQEVAAPALPERLASQGWSIPSSGQKPICLNTCSKARDGVCQDGRVPGGSQQALQLPRDVWCDLGTDCDDCGPWLPSGPAPWADPKVPGPVARLRARNVPVRIRSTLLQTSFPFAFTSKQKDQGVSREMEDEGAVEPTITRVFHRILKGRCEVQGGRRLMLDVGSNFGWFAIFSALMGCRVLAFEPVPDFRSFLEYNVHINGLAHLVDVRPHVVSHQPGQDTEVVVPSKGIWGTASIGGANIDPAIKDNSNEKVVVKSVTLDQIIQEDVLLMKVDVEGWEWSVMQGGLNAVSKHSVENIVMEYSPGVPERMQRLDYGILTVEMLINMTHQGYRVAHIEWPGGPPNLELALQPMQEVKADNLYYDLEDVKLYQKGQLGCPGYKPLVNLWHMWGACNTIPESLSPRSFRSLIGHNTNIWASKSKDLQPISGQVGILKPDAPDTQWFVPAGSVWGMGMRACAVMEPQVQVRHRCPCTNKTICGEQEDLAQKGALARQMPNNYIIRPQ